MEVFIATAKKIPEVGKTFDCCKVMNDHGYPYGIEVTTSIVREVRNIRPDMYGVITLNSVYVVNVSK